MKKFLTFLLLSFTFFMSVNSVYAQRATGEISGVVKDQSTQEILPYAVVNVKGTSLYSVTDPDGVFRITGINAGEITLEITFVGYATQTVEVSLNAGERKTVEIMLSDAYTSIGEVVVSAQRMGQNAAINQRLNSDALVNVVSKDAIRELPDINAAEAIGRLPGVSLTRSGGEGSTVILRGMDPKFASVNINGVKQPSTSLGNRTVDLSNISPEMLSGIEVFKSPTADMDADAIAGAVNLVISKAPDRPKNQFRLYGGYNGLSKSLGDFKGSWDFSRRFMDKKLGVMAQANFDKRDRSNHQIVRSYYVPDANNPEGLFINEVTLRKQERETKRYAGSLFLDYQLDHAGIYFNNTFNASPRHVYEQSEVYKNSREVTHQGNITKNMTTMMNNSLGGNVNLPIMKIDWNLTRVQTDYKKDYDMTWNFGRSGLLDNTKGVDWTKVEDPNVFFNNLVLVNGVDTLSRLGDFNFTPDTMKQVNYIAKIDFTIPFKISGDISGFIKVGGKYQTENRKRTGTAVRDWSELYLAQLQWLQESDPRQLDVNSETRILMSNFYDRKGADLMNGDYHMYAYMPESELSYWYDHHVKNSVGPMLSNACLYNPADAADRYYEAMERTAAAYIMLKLNYGKWLTLVPGLRYEHSNNDYTALYSIRSTFPAIGGYEREQKSNQTYGELLPSFHIKIQPIEWMDLRLSTVKTLSRPDYMWVLPRLKYNAASFAVQMSNPDLKHATAWNYDASITIYTGKFGLMSFGGYIKDISNMFYQANGTLPRSESLRLGLAAQTLNLTQTYFNLNDSYVRGLEFEYNTHFNFLPAPYNRFLLGFNVTRLWSGTYYLLWVPVLGIQMDGQTLERPTLGMDMNLSKYKKLEERMPTQVDWTSNAWLGFEYKGFSTRLSMAYQGTRLSNVNAQQESKAYNTYTDSALRLDFTAKQQINKMFSVLLNLNNITNEKDRSYRFISRYPTTTSMFGMTGELGVQINL